METKDVEVQRRIIDQSSQRTPVSKYAHGAVVNVEELIIRETPLTLFVNGQEVLTLLCTPTKETYLVAGFLLLEGAIASLEDVLYMRVCAEDGVAEVRLAMNFDIDTKGRTLTSGCGGGITFMKDLKVGPVDCATRISPEQVTGMMAALLQHAGVYRETGGVHTSALGDGERLLVVAEDVGRHNTIDKIAGECLLTGIATAGRILLTTGRVSSEMLAKSAKMGVAIVLSRSSPTDLAVKMAQDLNITLAGYVRGRSFNVYTHDWRIS